MRQKQMVVVVGLGLLGIAMIVIGAVGLLMPPALTGFGFLLLAWWVGMSDGR